MTLTFVRRSLVAFCVLIFVCSLRLNAQIAGCPQPFSEKQKQAVTAYVRKKYKLPDTIGISLKKDIGIRNTCFRELTFEGKSAFKTWEMTLYASPDARFLSSDLFDTSVDPVLEQREKDEAVMKGLVQGATAARGPEHARVTIVEFSDFQCPFCRKFALNLNEALASGADDVRVVFHHMPLSMHPWARTAAEMAGCAQLQSTQAFWSLYDQIFQNQEAITTENAKKQLADLAKNTKGVNATAFRRCMDAGMSVGLVLKDMDLAEAYQINATPTVFINGHRVQGVEGAAKLRELIADARKEAAASAAATPQKTVAAR